MGVNFLSAVQNVTTFWLSDVEQTVRGNNTENTAKKKIKTMSLESAK